MKKGVLAILVLALFVHNECASAADIESLSADDGMINVEILATYKVEHWSDLRRDFNVRIIALRDLIIGPIELGFEFNHTQFDLRNTYAEDSLGNMYVPFHNISGVGSDSRIYIGLTTKEITLDEGDHYSLRLLNIQEINGATKLGKYRIREYVGFPKMQNVKTIKRVFRLLVPLHEILFLTIANPYTRLDLILVDPSFDSSKFDEDYMALTLQPSEDMLGPRMWFLFDVEYRYVWNYSAMVFDLLKIAVGAALSLIVNALRKRASDR